MNTPSTSFKVLTEDLIEKVRGWRNQPRIRRNMVSDVAITSEQQSSWFRGLKGDSARKYMVFFQNDAPVGLLYFTSIGPDSCEWGCYIGEEAVWPGSGLLLEVAALDYAFDFLEVDFLLAEVFDFNVAPQRMHELFEYQNLGFSQRVVERDGVDCRLIRYCYKREDWVARRERVIGKLPEKMRRAAEKISFSDDE